MTTETAAASWARPCSHPRYTVALLALACASLCLGRAATADAQSFSSSHKAKVLYVGDSLAANTRDMVRWWTQGTGKAVVHESLFPGMAICDFLEGKSKQGMAKNLRLQAKVAEVEPDLIILQFWGNAFTPCMDALGFGTPASNNRYFWDALNAVNQIDAAARAAGIPRPKILWVLQPPTKGKPARSRALNDIYRFVAQQSRDRVVDAGRELSMAAYPYDDAPKDRDTWTQFLPCTELERSSGYCSLPGFGPDGFTQVRAGDGIHLCSGNTNGYHADCDTPSAGILRYGMQISGAANRWLGI